MRFKSHIIISFFSVVRSLFHIPLSINLNLIHHLVPSTSTLLSFGFIHFFREKTPHVIVLAAIFAVDKVRTMEGERTKGRMARSDFLIKFSGYCGQWYKTMAEHNVQNQSEHWILGCWRVFVAPYMLTHTHIQHPAVPPTNNNFVQIWWVHVGSVTYGQRVDIVFHKYICGVFTYNMNASKVLAMVHRVYDLQAIGRVNGTTELTSNQINYNISADRWHHC